MDWRRIFGQQALACLLLAGLLIPTRVTAQSASEASVERRRSTDTVQLRGVITHQKKYQFELRDENQETHTVKLAPGAPLALRLNRPYFDWQSNKVFVVPVAADAPYESDFETPIPPEEHDGKPVKRVPVRIPAQPLYLISRFRSEYQVQRFMKERVKRMTFYLITPESLEPVFPSNERMFLAGQLVLPESKEVDAPNASKPGQLKLKVGKRSFPIHLGFRMATMNGYHLGDLKAGQTRVVLTGTRDQETGTVLASRVLFEPILITDP